MRVSEGGKRLDMQLEEQGQVQVISTHVRFPDASPLSHHAPAELGYTPAARSGKTCEIMG